MSGRAYKAGFRTIRPEIIVVVAVSIPSVAIGRICSVEVLPIVFNHVVIGEDLADIKFANLVEVVEPVGIDGAGIVRIEDYTEIEYFREEVFNIVRQTIAIRIGNAICSSNT